MLNDCKTSRSQTLAHILLAAGALCLTAQAVRAAEPASATARKSEAKEGSLALDANRDSTIDYKEHARAGSGD